MAVYEGSQRRRDCLRRHRGGGEGAVFIAGIKKVPTEEGRSAELALFRRKPDEAEAILVQAGLMYRAVDMRVRLFDWDRALDLAVQHKTHVDTVIYHRNKYLEHLGRRETNQKFVEVLRLGVNEEQVLMKVEQEREREAQRPGADEREYQTNRRHRASSTSRTRTTDYGVHVPRP